MDTPDFVEGHYDTGFIAKNGEVLQQCITRTSERAENIALIAGLHGLPDEPGRKQQRTGSG